MPRMTTPTPINADRLEHLLQERGELQARGRLTPREVFARWLDNAGVGVGVGVGAAVVLYLFRAPDAAMLTVAPSVGLLAFAIMMAWRGSEDERSDWRNTRAIKRTVAAIQRDADAQVATLRRQLDAAFDEIESLERALDRMTQERDDAVRDLSRERTAARSNSGKRDPYVPAVAMTPEKVRDATTMIRHRFDYGKHPSKDICTATYNWSDERWKAAQSELVAARIIQVNTTQTKWVVNPLTLDTALRQFGAYVLHAHSLSAPAISRTLGIEFAPEDEE